MPTTITIDQADGSEIALSGLAQITITEAGFTVVPAPGVTFKESDGRLEFTQDVFTLLPRLEDILEDAALLAYPGGKAAVTRLRFTLNEHLKRYPDTLVGNSFKPFATPPGPRWITEKRPPVDKDPLPGFDLEGSVGCVFFMSNGIRVQVNITAEGNLTMPVRCSWA